MRILKIEDKSLSDLENSVIAQLINLSKDNDEKILSAVKEIINNVKTNGDESLINYSNKFDKTNFTKAQDFKISANEIDEAVKNIDKNVYEALKTAYERIFSYHKKQLPQDFIYTDEIGAKLGNLWKNIESIGIYAPGGSASYPSSVLMSAVPAIVAGVKNITLCVPTLEGKLNPAILVAAKICGINEIYKIGGAQAIAAMCFGTKTIKKVDKIVGPGNSYVATAKKILYGEVGIDMIAGPTDITVICDQNNQASWIAADALSQLEHGVDSKAFIITDNENFASEIINSINELKEKLPRKKIIEESLKLSAIFIINDLNKAVDISNFIAPEHLEISCNQQEDFVKKIKNAGAIFIGKYSPESIGDYIAGPSHTLPTSQTARFASGLSVYDFLKRISLINLDKKAFATLAKQTSILADLEGLQAHKLSIDIRNEN